MNRKNNVNAAPGAADACHSMSSYRGQMKDYAVNIGVGSSLPVELISFKATPEDQHINLYWITGSERDNELFLIEHSVDGTNWKQLDSVKSQGNSSEEQFYQLIHWDPAYGVNYYLLSQKDKNGEWKQLDRLSVSSLENQVQVYPNPCFNELKVSGLERNSELYVFNTVWEQEKGDFFSEKEAEVILDWNDLKPGIYFLVVKDDSGEKTFQIVRE